MAQTAVFVIATVRRDHHQVTLYPQFHSSRELAQEWLDMMTRENPGTWEACSVVEFERHWSESQPRELVVAMVAGA